MTLFICSISSILKMYRLRPTKISNQGLLRLISSNDVIHYGVAFYSHHNITAFAIWRSQLTFYLLIFKTRFLSFAGRALAHPFAHSYVMCALTFLSLAPLSRCSVCACVKYFNRAIWLFMVLNSGRNFTFSLGFWCCCIADAIEGFFCPGPPSSVCLV